MKPTRNNSPETILRQWRVKILNIFFGVVAVISLPAIGTIIADAASQPELRPIAIAFSFVELGLIALAVLRRLPINLRVGGLWLIGYIAAILNLLRTALGGAGPLYLLVIPILILILAGKRASFFTAIFSGLLAIGCAILVQQGLLVPDLTVRSQATSLTTFIMFLTVVMTILILFYRLQERLIDDERHVQADLLHARAMLEEQNVLLEQKIQERTGELQASNLSLEQRNAELALLNSVSTAMTKTLDVKALAHIVGDKIREIFDVDSALIMLLDRHTNLIHILFEYDKNEGGYIDYVEPFPLGTGLSSKVITSGQPLMASTLEEEVASGAYFPPEIIEKGSGFFSQSWLGVPILAKDQVMGLVALADGRPYAFNENHLHLLQTLSSNVGAVLDNARLFTETEYLLKETEQRNKELAIINKIQQALASKLDFQAIIDLFGNEIIRIFPPEQGNAENYSAMIALYESQSNLIQFPYLINGEGKRFVQPAMGMGLGLTSTVIQSGRPLVLKTIEEQIAHGLVDYADEKIRAKSQSWMGVPVRSGDRVMGVFSVEDPRPNLFTEVDVRLLSTLAASLGVALENAHLFGETQRLLKETEQRNRELVIINNIQKGLASKLDLQSMIDLFGDELMKIFPPEERKAHNYSVFIALYDPKTKMIQFPYLIDGSGNRFIEPPTELGAGLTSVVIKSGQTLVLNTLEEQVAHGVILFTKSKVHIDSQSWVGVPIKNGEQVIGVVSMQDRRPNLFTESDIRLLNTLASNLEVALENARLFNETQQRAAELSTINTVSTALIRELDLGALINLVGEQIRSIFKADIVYVALLDAKKQLINFPYQFGEKHEPLAVGQGLTSKVIQTGRPLLINREMEQRRKELGTTLVGKKTRSFLGVPVFVQGEAVGVISVQNTAREDAFNEKDQHLLNTIAANVGIALQNARLFEEIKHQEQQAQEMQRRLADIINFLPDSTLVIDHESKVIAWNHAIEEMTGVPAVDMLGKGNHEYALPFYGERQPILIDLVLLPQEEVEKKYTQIKREGGILSGVTFTPALKDNGRFLYATASALHNVNGEVVGAIEIIRDITERIQVENELRESNEKLRLIFESAFDGINVYEEFPDEGKRILLDCNDRYCEMAGRSREELMSVENTSIFQRSIANPWEELGTGTILDQEAFSGVFSWIRPDGKENIIEYNAAPTKVGDRFLTIGLDRDVTERMRVENELRESNEKLRLIFESAFDGISVYEEIPSENKRILLDCNERYCQLAGRSKEELLAISDTRSIQHSIENAPENEDQESIVAEQTFSGTFTWLRPDGKENIIEYNAAPTKVGDRYFTIGLDRDITDRKEAEEALRKSEHLYRSVIDNSVDVFYRADRDGNIVLASPSGATLLGYDSVKDLIGLNLLRDVYFNPEDRKPLLEEIQKHGFVKNFETKIKRRDGTPIVVLVNSRAYVDENGKTLGIEGFLRDFSDRKQMEDDLRQAKAEAEQANHAKSAFLANMSHELRTPLSAIIGFTRIVRRKGETVLPEKQIENLDKVLTSADNLLSLINTVLDIAKIEAGRMDVLPANFRIHPLIDLCANTAQPLLRPTVTLEKNVAENLTYIYSDQDKIRQIILNLLSNAAKFTHTGKISLDVSQSGENLHITVSDTGIGISAEALPHIFKEFEQADTTTTRKYGGTGLGLTISRNLARLLGGDITVESESGQGSTFTLVIPVHYKRDLSQLEAAALPTSDLRPVSSPQGASVSGTTQHSEASSAKKHILVIDDDPDAIYLLQENLDQQEYQISGCHNGLDGLQMARQLQPQAILLDILMPGADGWQVLHDLKNDQVTAGIPVILHTIVDKKTLGFQLGASAYLLKPLDPVAVRETLERVIVQDAHRPKQVLVVDDDPNVADMLRQFLPESDFSLKSALDGLAGLKSIETHRPDILLLDLLMPKLDGFGVIEQVRANPETRDMPIIVITAKDLSQNETAHLRKRVAVVIKKQGFEGERIIEEIQRAVKP